MIFIALLAELPLSQKFALVLIAPFGAILYWYTFLFMLLVSEYLGTYGIVLSRVLVIYYYLFSRLVVQEPPVVSLSLTRR
jgi:hypothetical protein